MSWTGAAWVVPQITQRISSSGVITHEHESFIKPECIPESHITSFNR